MHSMYTLRTIFKPHPCILSPAQKLLCFHYVSDVDECSSGRSHCSGYATCYNTAGSYKCKCRDGFRGMGHDCKRKDPTDKNPSLRSALVQVGTGPHLFLFSFPTLAFFFKKKKKSWENRSEGGTAFQAERLKFLSL